LPPADRVGLVVDWRISEYELVDDNEASHVDKPLDKLTPAGMVKREQQLPIPAKIDKYVILCPNKLSFRRKMHGNIPYKKAELSQR